MGALLAVSLLVLAGLARWQVAQALHSAQQEVAARGQLKFSVRQVSPVPDRGFEWISAPANFNQAMVFQGKFYICGPAGLLEYDDRGNLLKHYRAGLDLPASPLLRMAKGVLSDAREPELLIATAGEGVLAFNGSSFRQILPQDAETRTLTTILPLSSGHLLLGTRKRGVLVYDGKSLHAFHSTLAGLSVTELAGTEADLWVGTLDQGVVHWQGGQAEAFDETQGLPDSQVYSIAVAGDNTYVGTALGVAQFERGTFARVLARGAFAQTLYVSGSKLLVGGMDQGIQSIELGQQRIAPPLSGELGRQITDVRQIFREESKLYALAAQGLYSLSQQGAWQRVLSEQGTLLADRNISALAADSKHHLWVGFFDRGLDLLDASGKRAEHIENDNIFCVNRIVPEISKGVTAVATANGLALFDSAGHQQQVLGRSDGLLSDHVNDVAPYGNGMAIATPAGLTFLDATGARSMYAFHGLVNNHIYTLGVRDNQVLAGTLGGISLVENEQVTANYTTANTGLEHNWISAVALVDNEWLIGTYGAGIERLNHDGQFETLQTASDKFDVNPNAMLVTENHVFTGTLERGLYSYNRASGKWSVITEGLPSVNVTALAADGGYLYVGTDNGLVRIPEQSLP